MNEFNIQSNFTRIIEFYFEGNLSIGLTLANDLSTEI